MPPILPELDGEILTGTDIGESLEGSELNDLIEGLAGDDTIEGLDGDDVLIGGAGADFIDGGDGRDIVSYADSDEAIRTSFLNTTALTGGDAEGDILRNIEIIVGSAFDDRMEIAGADTLFGGDGNDILTGRGGALQFFAETGNDTISLSTKGNYAGATFDGGEGTDTLTVFTSGVIDFTQSTLVSLERLNFAGNVDVYNVTFLASQFGFSFVSNLRSSGDANMTILMEEETDIDLSAVGFQDGAFDKDDIFILGDDDAETIIGSVIADDIDAGAGDDTVEGGIGFDVLEGGDGVDTLSYAGSSAGVVVSLDTGAASGGDAEGDIFSGFENLLGSSFDDTFTGTSGVNEIDAGAGDDTVEGGLGSDVLEGGDGVDTLSYAGSSAGVVVALHTRATSGGDAEGDVISGFENLIGSSFDDTFTGTSGANEMDGGAGDDLLKGLGGDDTLRGGGGDDTLVGGGGADNMFGGGGADALSGGGAADTLFGGGGDDDLNGGAGGDALNGGAGTDALNGGNGADTLEGGDGDDTLIGGNSGDDLFGDQGDDTLSGGNGNDALFGGEGGDKLNGGTGRDRLDGGVGDDTLVGGSDVDTFVFGLGGAADRIVDFEGGTDRLELEEALWGGGLTEAELVDGFAVLNRAGNAVTFDFGDGDVLTVRNAAGIDLAGLVDDILLV